MKIEYLGHSCFCIENKAGVKIVMDPYSRVGYELPNNLKAQVVTVSHNHFDHNHAEGIKGYPVVISSAGEYELHGVKIVGKNTWHDQEKGRFRGGNVMFTVEVDGVTICHFGDLGEMNFEKIGSIASEADIWLLPVGGTYTINGEQAKQYVDKFVPKMVIPMHYRPQDGTLDISPASDFLGRFKPSEITCCPSGIMTIEESDLPTEGNNLKKGRTKIVYMERKK